MLDCQVYILSVIYVKRCFCLSTLTCTAEVCQLYFEHLQKLWPVLLELQFNGQHTISMIPFLSLTCDILKFKLANDSRDADHYPIEDLETNVLSCQTSVVDICTQKMVPHLLGHCSNLFEMKKCLGLFTRVCDSRLVQDHYGLCSVVLDKITSSSVVKHHLLNWLSLQSHSTDIHCLRDHFGVSSAVAMAVAVDADMSLLATMVRKLIVLVIKCLSVTVGGGKGKKQSKHIHFAVITVH